jgi:hypothetical protein
MLQHMSSRRLPRTQRLYSFRISQIIFVASVLLGIVTMEPLIIAGGLSAALIATWMFAADELPVMLFCLAYQLMFLVTGVCYRGVFGLYPSDHQPVQLDFAIAMLLVTIVAMTFGIRTSMKIVSESAAWNQKWRTQAPSNYSIQKLFYLSIVVFAVAWIMPINPQQLSSAFGQIIGRVLEFRLVFLYLLFVMILRANRGYGYGFMASVVVAVPAVTTGGSGFAQVMILFFVALISEGKSVAQPEFLQDRRRVFLAVSSAFLLGALALIWTGAIKAPWRALLREGQAAPTVMGKIDQFFTLASETVPDVDLQDAAWNQAKRISDVPILMAFVTERIPSQMPHEGGKLTLRAIKHVLMPRFLFPDKENLGSDSALVRQYTGLYVAGDESGASIGLGYMIEFYIDYGPFGMVIAGFVFGLAVGAAYRSLYLVSPSKEIYVAVLIAIMLLHFLSPDGSLAKICGGLVMAFVVQSVILVLVGKRIHLTLRDNRDYGSFGYKRA